MYCKTWEYLLIPCWIRLFILIIEAWRLFLSKHSSCPESSARALSLELSSVIFYVRPPCISTCAVTGTVFFCMFPRRGITEIIQQYQPGCRCTMTQDILQGLLWLLLACEAPAGMAEASLIVYRCCVKLSPPRPVRTEFFWWLCVCVCVFISLDKTSKKKKAATLGWSLICLWMLFLSHARTGCRAILL